jgi:hypothetical protein
MIKRQMYGRAGFALLATASCSSNGTSPPKLRQSRWNYSP